MTTTLLLFNSTERGMTHDFGVSRIVHSNKIFVIKTKKHELDTAVFVRNESCVQIPKNIPDSHLRVLYKNSVEYKIPIKIITKLISIESDWVKDTSSYCGAYGYGQIMPSTKRYIARELGERVRKDPKQDIKYTIFYLHEMLNEAHGDMRLALAYYNAGPNKIHKYGTNISRKYTNAIMRCSE